MTPFTFHTSSGGNPTGIGDYMRLLDAAGIEMGLVSIGNYGPIHEGVLLARASGLNHQFVFRVTDLDVPNYGIDAATAALNHWAAVKTKLPPEFDKERVWICPLNEIDKDRSNWLGDFATVFAATAIAEGYKVTMFGWSAGEPEPEHWQLPGMRRYLELCALHPDRAAVALHEYSYDLADIRHEFPYKIGRFQALFNACDAMGIARPTVHITEWGWTHEEVPEPTQALLDIDWAYQLYAPHSRIKVVAIWGLISGFGGIANLAQKLIAPVTQFMLNTPIVEPPPPPPTGRGEPRTQYKRTYVLLPPGTNKEWARAAVDGSWDNHRYTIGGSADDAGIGNLDQRHVIVVNPADWGPGDDGTGITGFYQTYYPGVQLNILQAATPDELAALLSGQEPIDDIDLTVPLSGPYVITSDLDDPRDYDGDGNYDDKHEGVDFAPTQPGSRVLSAAPGIVHRVRDAGGYGKYVILSHENGRYYTWYAHMNRQDVVEGQAVARSQPLGLVGSTGNSSGLHVHFNLQVPGRGAPGYVIPDVVNPIGHMNLTPINIGQHPVDFGLHASADPDITPAEIELFRIARPEMIKVMSLHPEAAVRQLATNHPAARFVVRAYLSFRNRPAVSPQQFYDDTINDVQRTLGAIGSGRDVVIELHNEPNLVDEGLGVSWADGASFNNWYIQLISRYRGALPAARFIFPGLSPGDDIPGIRQGHESFINQCRDAVLASDGLGVHAYWAANYPMSLALGVVDGYRSRFPAQAIWVTEACNNQAGPTPTQKAQEYVMFWQLLRQRPMVRGITYFVASASNPQWGWGPGGTGQVWLGTNIPVVVGAR